MPSNQQTSQKIQESQQQQPDTKNESVPLKRHAPSSDPVSPNFSSSSPSLPPLEAPPDLMSNHQSRHTSGGDASENSDDDAAPFDADALAAQIAEQEKARERALKPYRKVVEHLASRYALIAMPLAAASPGAAAVLLDQAHNRATELVRACMHSKRAMKWLMQFSEAGDIIDCIGGHLTMLYVILVVSGRLPLDMRAIMTMKAAGYGHFLSQEAAAGGTGGTAELEIQDLSRV